MGKKSRLKKRRYNLRKHEFIQYMCAQCGLCAPGTQANFCYDGHYLESPKRFIKFVLPKLKELKGELSLVGPKQTTLQDDDDFEFTLEEAFCDSNMCGNAGISAGVNCMYKLGCLQSLRAQARASDKKVMSLGVHRGRKRNKSKKNKRHKKKYVPPTPMFFCNDSFRAEVDKIIGNNTEQQNKGEESARSSSAGAGGQAEDSKS